jgi:hypothetical protein
VGIERVELSRIAPLIFKTSAYCLFRHIPKNWCERRDSNSHPIGYGLVPKTSAFFLFRHVRIKFGAGEKIRTSTEQNLSLTPLPIGVRQQNLVQMAGFEPARRLPTLPSQGNATTHFATSAFGAG